MDDFMKSEAKDIISTAIEKASGATGINVEVSLLQQHYQTKMNSTYFEVNLIGYIN